MIENILIFLFGGLTALLFVIFFRKKLGQPRDESIQVPTPDQIPMGRTHPAGMDPGDYSENPEFVEVAFLLNSLKAKQEIQTKLLEHMPIGVLLLDNQFNVLSGNRQGFELINVLDPAFNQVFVSQLGDKTILNLVEGFADPMPIELKVAGPPAGIFEIQLRSVQTVEGQYWILMISDVTEERGIENNIRMQERLATLGQFAAGISHDFRNILSAILIYSDVILRDSQLSEENRSRMTAVRKQSQRAADLISGILDFSSGHTVDQRIFNLIPFLEDTRDLLVRVIPENIQITVDVKGIGETLPILGNPGRLQQMIMNLALNSRDAMPDGGDLLIQLKRIDFRDEGKGLLTGMSPGPWNLLEVKDTGTGIDLFDQVRVFEPFFTTKSAQGGTGLGMAQVYGVVKQHKGFIDLESEPGSGTTIKIFLPIQLDEIERIQEDLSEISIDGGGDLILVVEDDKILQQALWNCFEEHNFQVVLAENGIQGIDILNTIGERISLVISDLIMPQMGGVELYQKTREQFPEKKVILITGHPTPEIEGVIDQDQNLMFLLKPFSMTDILLLSKEIRAL